MSMPFVLRIARNAATGSVCFLVFASLLRGPVLGAGRLGTPDPAWAGLSAAAQEVDPFYVKLLDSGVSLYQSGSYSRAVQDLEIATFGFGRASRFAARAFAYLALSYAALSDLEKARAALNKASALLGQSSPTDLDLDETAASAMQKLSGQLGVHLGPGGDEPSAAKTDAGAVQDKATAPEKKSAETRPPVKEEVKTTTPPLSSKTQAEAAGTGREATPPVAAPPVKEKKEPPAKPRTEAAAPPPTKVPPEKKRETRVDTGAASKAQGKAETTEKPRAAAAGAAKAEEKAPPSGRTETPSKTKSTPPAQTTPAPPRPEPRPVEPDVAALEARLESNPADAALVYELAPVYFRQGDFEAARKILSGLIAKRPRETQGIFLLAKAEFFLKDYKAALRKFRDLSRPSRDSGPAGQDFGLRTALYTALCLINLNQRESAVTFINYVKKSTSPDELARVVREEGLTEYWDVLKIPVRR